MKRIITTVCLLLAAALAAAPATACDLCAAYSAMEAKTAKPGLNLGVFEQYTHFGTIQVDGRDIGNPADQYLDSSITQFIVGYQVNDKVGLQVNIPYINRSFRRTTPDGAIETGHESGLGDLSLLARYRLYQHLSEDTIFAWDVIGGIKFPTGSSDRLKEELAEADFPPDTPESGVHGHDLALGSGSYDGIVGTALFARWKRLFATGNVQYAIRTSGDLDYRYANDLTWSVKPGGYLWLDHHGSAGLQLALSGETKNVDTFAGATAPDTGISSVFLGPDLSLTWRENLSAEVGAEIPVMVHNTALQIVPDYKIHAAVTWRF